MCARNISSALHDLSSLSHHTRKWFMVGRSRKEAVNSPISTEFDSISGLLQKGINRRETDKLPIPNLGYRCTIWNGEMNDSAVSISFQCGGYSPHISNGVVINLPNNEEIWDFKILRCAMEILVRRFSPDWGTVNTALLRDQVLRLPETAIQVGWMTYLSSKIGNVPPHPKYEAEIIDGYGSVVVATRDRFSVQNAEHQRRALMVAEEVSRLPALGR